MDLSTRYVFNYLLPNDELGMSGNPDDDLTEDIFLPNHIENQYRVLNQVVKIYDKFYDNPINPYSSLKIRFKMKTVTVFPPGNSINDAEDKVLFLENPLDESLDMAPKIEVGVLKSQFEEIPKTGVLGLPNYLGDDREFKSPGGFNSERYFNGNNYLAKKDSKLGGMSRFQNSVMNEWETFEFDFNLTEEHNNRGRIHGVPYGGSFDDVKNFGPIEIMLNHKSDSDGLPEENPGEIYFKLQGYQSDDTALTEDKFWIIPPPGVTLSSGNTDGESVFVRHAPRGGTGSDYGYMTVFSALGDTTDGAPGGEQNTGLQDDGRFLEAYLMYVGSLNPQMRSGLGYGDNDNDDEPKADMVVAYWDGERWSYDDNSGYLGEDGDDTSKYLYLNNECFIIARLYRSSTEEGNGITGMDQYISNASQFPTDGVGNLSLFLQAGNNFQGRVLLDDIECYESYEFTPEVDVRKKISVGNYGRADLTKYYDKELQSNMYKDTQAPLEAQFYFYPQYPTNETLDIEQLPIYQDFKLGRFYIYDVDWGDGTPRGFTAEPEQIDENTALYHTYETNGIFEINGTMVRVKTDENNNIMGIIYNKKFRLRINVNSGTDEDFKYFGSDGYSFIPYENTTPIIGGISQQSNYYKKVKRQLGFLENEKIKIDFKNKSDKLKTELALLKMENQNFDNLEVLPAYMEERLDEDDNVIYNGISPIKEELGKGLGDCDLTNVKFYNTPKSIWEMFGFEEEDLNQVGNPDKPRYWKNIIPKDYSIFNREGIIEEPMNTETEQEWIDGYYYPVLPAYGTNGRFIENEFRNRTPFPLQGSITDETESDKDLIINVINDKVDVDIFNDQSGNKNYGFPITDFSPEFDDETLRVEKVKQTSIVKVTKRNGAF